MKANRKTIAVNGAFFAQPVTGVQRYARELVSALVRWGGQDHRLVLIAPVRDPKDPLPDASFAEKADLVLDRTRLPGPLWIQLRLPGLLRRLGSPLLWSPANIGPLSVRNQVLTIHDGSVFERPEWFSRPFRLYYRALLPRLGKRVLRVLTGSEFSRRELVRHGVASYDQIEVVPCGVSPNFHPAADAGDWVSRKPYLLAVGSRDPRKNLATLFRAWRLLERSRTPGLRLLVAGARSPVFGRERAGKVPPGVEFLGFVPDLSLPGLYAAASGLVYPSLYEGFGLPPLEAMACGTPVLASNAASLPEACGEAALYFNPLDPRELAEKIEVLLNDLALRTRLRAAGTERAAGFTWERAAERMGVVLSASSS